MPIPQPKDNEKRNDYVGRCMHKLAEDKMPNKQKVAICLNTFNNPKKKSDGTNVEIDFSEQIKEMKEKKAKEEAEKQAKSVPVVEPVIEQKVETPAPVIEEKIEPVAEVKVETPVVEPTHTAVTAPAEPVAEVKIEEKTEVKASEIKAETDGRGELIQNMMLQIQNQYKIFHWQTASYSQHKSFGDVYDSLSDQIDEFIETYMGKYGRIIASNSFNIDLTNYSSDNFNSITDVYINFLINISSQFDPAKDSDLLNIRDEILGSLNKLKYLLTLG